MLRAPYDFRQLGPHPNHSLYTSPYFINSISPLTIPFHCGWFRQVVGAAPPYQFVYYLSPSGAALSSEDQLAEYLQITNSPLTMDLFSFDANVDCFLGLAPMPSKIFELADLSMGRERAPVQCVNSVDTEYPVLEEYVTTYVPGPGVVINQDKNYLVCCDCTDNCLNKAKCACWQLTLEGSSGLPVPVKGYLHGRLHDNVISGIFECNDRCNCRSKCVNKVTQHGAQWPLQVFKTRDKGWGVRALFDMPKGAFVCLYMGEILEDKFAERNGKEKGDEYYTELDFIEVWERGKPGYESDVEEESEEETSGEETSEEGTSEEGASEEEDEGPRRKQTARKATGGRPPRFQLARPPERWTVLKGTRARRAVSPVKLATMSLRFGVGWGQRKTIFRKSKTPTAASNCKSARKKEPKKIRTRRLYNNERECYVVDAKRKGNVGRFLNHSCSPNVFTQNVFVSTHDLRFPRIALFTSEVVKAGSELTWDYKYKVGSVPGKVLRCYCGSPNCRGRLL